MTRRDRERFDDLADAIASGTRSASFGRIALTASSIRMTADVVPAAGFLLLWTASDRIASLSMTLWPYQVGISFSFAGVAKPGEDAA